MIVNGPAVAGLRPNALHFSGADWAQTNAVRQELQKRIQSLGPEFAQDELVDRWYQYSAKGYQHSLVYFEWRDRRTVQGMQPHRVAEVLKRIRGVKPAAKALKELQEAGYNEGFPNPRNLPFAYNAIYRNEVQKSLKPGEFYKNTFAFTLPKGSKLSPQRTYLIAAEMDFGEYHDELSYIYTASAALERRLRAMGLPQASTSVRVANYPGFSTEPIAEGPFKGHSKATFTIMLDKQSLRGPDKTQSADMHKVLTRMRELIPASEAKDALRKAHYDGYYQRGEYPKNVYALDLRRLSGLKYSAHYPRYVLVDFYDSHP